MQVTAHRRSDWTTDGKRYQASFAAAGFYAFDLNVSKWQKDRIDAASGYIMGRYDRTFGKVVFKATANDPLPVKCVLTHMPPADGVYQVKSGSQNARNKKRRDVVFQGPTGDEVLMQGWPPEYITHWMYNPPTVSGGVMTAEYVHNPDDKYVFHLEFDPEVDKFRTRKV